MLCLQSNSSACSSQRLRRHLLASEEETGGIDFDGRFVLYMFFIRPYHIFRKSLSAASLANTKTGFTRLPVVDTKKNVSATCHKKNGNHFSSLGSIFWKV
jgi:hypothetical protein